MDEKYTKEGIINNIKNSSKKDLYKAACVNYTGFTTDTKEKYTEVIAGHLLSNIAKYSKDIPCVTREASYRVKGHKWHAYIPGARQEERLARSLYNQPLNDVHDQTLLHIVDYQVPLKNEREGEGKESKGLGKIDLLAWDDSGYGLLILELKKPGSSETLLRCVLEAYTYWKTVDHKKLWNDFGYKGKPRIGAAVLIFAQSQPCKDWRDEKQLQVDALRKALGVGVYVLAGEKDLRVTKVDRGASYDYAK